MKKILKIAILLVFWGILGGKVVSQASTINFSYEDDKNGQYISDGVSNGDTHNYNYGNVNDVIFDNEGYINYDDNVYLKKSVKANPNKQGLFDVTLDVKGDTREEAKDVDLILVIDFSSTMIGEPLKNIMGALNTFMEESEDDIRDGHLRIGIVCYNRFVYSTEKFSTDIEYLENFLNDESKSHHGSFTQKGLIEAERMFEKDSRKEADHILIHIGDGDANRSYLPVENAETYQNKGEIMDWSNTLYSYHTDTYYKDFQSESPKFYYTGTLNDEDERINAVENKNAREDIFNHTLGTVVSMKQKGIEFYSVGVNPENRGEYLARNLASNPSVGYHEVDENLSDLQDAFREIESSRKSTIIDGKILDPMGNDILLQGTGDFTEKNYTIKGWIKNSDGNWIEDQTVLTEHNVAVTEKNQTISVLNLVLGKDERVTLTYHVRINTESSNFKGETWYLCNGKTIITPKPNESEDKLDFPIPSVKSPNVELEIEKTWENIKEDLIPDSIEFVVSRTTITSNTWDTSDPVKLTKNENYKKSYSFLTINDEEQEVELPLYNNQGDDFIYTVKEVNIPDVFESTVNSNDNTFIINNKFINPIKISKEVDKNLTENGTVDPVDTAKSRLQPITYTINTANTSATSSMDKVRILDVLPFNQDDRQTSFNAKGTAHVLSAQLVDANGEAVKGARLYYKDPSQAETNTKLDPNSLPQSATELASKGWLAYDGSDASVLEKTSAILVDVDNIPANTTYALKITVEHKDNVGADLINNATVNSIVDQKQTTNNVETKIYGRELSGYVWYDDNYDGLKDDAEAPVKDLAVKLYRTSLENPNYKDQLVTENVKGEKFIDDKGNSLIKTDDKGFYIFSNLSEGHYIAEFEINGKLQTKEYQVTKFMADSSNSDAKNSKVKAEEDRITAQNPIKGSDWNDVGARLKDLDTVIKPKDGLQELPYNNLGLNRSAHLDIFKKNILGDGLAGAKFAIYRGDLKEIPAEGEQNTDFIGTYETDETGHLKVNQNLFAGYDADHNPISQTYTVFEIKAPNGYELLKTPVTFTVKEGNQTINLQIKNDSTAPLPFTGGKAGIGLLIALSLVVLGMLGLGGGLFYRHRKNSKEAA